MSISSTPIQKARVNQTEVLVLLPPDAKEPKYRVGIWNHKDKDNPILTHVDLCESETAGRSVWANRSMFNFLNAYRTRK